MRYKSLNSNIPEVSEFLSEVAEESRAIGGGSKVVYRSKKSGVLVIFLNAKNSRLRFQLHLAEPLQVFISMSFPYFFCIRSAFLSVQNLIVESWIGKGAA
eukprot:Plantae.Rhodophyta-Palmaria_palmata.ctg348.p1 GENE.Plantae.Rhodophyta-Palmaria_palmata.ctg348~~Plantae.Rhodophyta-Palmaria_palmata.ctg348.p1  ORF type:complete len:100 (+),score=1.86 Plantae.Rhodophyta-Palmaria_palmata.ctg348:816-1115(+)